MAKIFVSFTIVSTADFFLVVRELPPSLAEAYRSDVLHPPHTQRNVTVDNLNPIMYRVELWTTVDGVNLNQLRGRCDIDASQYTTVAFTPIYFITGRGLPLDPAANTSQYDNTDLAGKDYLVFMPGFGPLIEGIHIAKNLDVNNVDLGGFHFINGQTFLDGAEYTIMISNLSTQQVQAGGGNNSGYPIDIVPIIADTNLDQTHYLKLLEVISQNNNNIILNVPDINLIPDNTKVGINTHNFNTSHGFRYAILQLPLGSYCLVNGVQRNTVYVGRGENVSFMKKGAYLRVINDWRAPHLVGTRVFCDGNSPLNGLPFHGGWYPIAQYARLFYWYINNLPPSELGTGYTDDQNPDALTRLRWIIGNLKFWVPDHRLYFYRNSGPGRDINTFEDNSLQPANIKTTAWTGSGVGKASLSVNSIGFLATQGDGGEVTTDGASNVNRTTARTNTWPLITSSSETRPKNVSQAVYVLY